MAWTGASQTDPIGVTRLYAREQYRSSSVASGWAGKMDNGSKI
jgi:hypothetical protein